MNKRKQLRTIDQAVPAKRQHKSPCSDCPWARASYPGWLGGPTADEWLADVHGDCQIPCHVFSGAQCAGAAIYRANLCKVPRDKTCLTLPADHKKVFASPTEFKAHHAGIDKSSEEAMPDYCIVTSAELQRLHRIDPSFVILVKKHEALFNELITKFTVEELVALAARLPYYEGAAIIVTRSSQQSLSRAEFEKRMSTYRDHPHHRSNLAAYCAAAAQCAQEQVMTEIDALERLKSEKLKNLSEIYKLGRFKRAIELPKAVKFRKG